MSTQLQPFNIHNSTFLDFVYKNFHKFFERQDLKWWRQKHLLRRNGGKYPVQKSSKSPEKTNVEFKNRKKVQKSSKISEITETKLSTNDSIVEFFTDSSYETHCYRRAGNDTNPLLKISLPKDIHFVRGTGEQKDSSEISRLKTCPMFHFRFEMPNECKCELECSLSLLRHKKYPKNV